MSRRPASRLFAGNNILRQHIKIGQGNKIQLADDTWVGYDTSGDKGVETSGVHWGAFHGIFPGVGKLGIRGQQFSTGVQGWISGGIWEQSPQTPTTGCENSA